MHFNKTMDAIHPAYRLGGFVLLASLAVLLGLAKNSFATRVELIDLLELAFVADDRLQPPLPLGGQLGGTGGTVHGQDQALGGSRHAAALVQFLHE